jgi:hypothetical protein
MILKMRSLLNGRETGAVAAGSTAEPDAPGSTTDGAEFRNSGEPSASVCAQTSLPTRRNPVKMTLHATILRFIGTYASRNEK